jgi:hypothetical protein
MNTGGFLPVVEVLKNKANQSPPATNEVMNLHFLSPFGMVLMHRDNFTFTYYNNYFL